MLGCISSTAPLSPEETLGFITVQIESAHKLNIDGHARLASILCKKIGSQLSQLNRTKVLNSPSSTTGRFLWSEIADAYTNYGKLLTELRLHDKALASYSKAKKWQDLHESSRQDGAYERNGVKISIAQQGQVPAGIATIPPEIFPQNVTQAVPTYPLPELDGRLEDTNHLVFCLSLLSNQSMSGEELYKVLDDAQLTWLNARVDNQEEKERLAQLVKQLVDIYINNKLKDAAAIAEVTSLAPILNKNTYVILLNDFITIINQSKLLDFSMLEGLSRMIQRAPPGHLESDNLEKILETLSNCLQKIRQDSTLHIPCLIAVSHVLDTMVDNYVKDLSRENLRDPLLSHLKRLREHPDPYVVFQATYAIQALQFVPDDETPWQAALRRSGALVRGLSGLVSAAKGFDVNGIIEGLTVIHGGLSEVYDAVMKGYDDIKELVVSGKEFLSCLEEALPMNGSIVGQQYTWFTALRCLNVVIQQGHFADFRKLICNSPFRHHPAFQWGVCQLLGEIAYNDSWDISTRKSSINFLSELYKNDDDWGQQATIKQWILSIIKNIKDSSAGIVKAHANTVFKDLEKIGDANKKALYQVINDKPPTYPLNIILKVGLPPLVSPSLLDIVQNIPDVEKDLRQLRKQRLKLLEQGAIYIPPQAKSTRNASDDALFPLMKKVEEFLEKEQEEFSKKKQKVFLLLGESGAGKSTFSRELERKLWEGYKKGGTIPLYINLPAIDKPEHNLVAKYLRKAEFSESQIREMKKRRNFILICDGYDESHQTQNLYVKNQLNEVGEFQAQMVVSCRLEYIGKDYLDQFQPTDRNHLTDHYRTATQTQCQEAVMAPFTKEQVNNYIEQYVTKTRPIWKASKYIDALNKIPNLLDLVKNPFLLALSLEVLPRVDLQQDAFTHSQVTRVALYDQFVEQWFEREKKRIAEMKMGDQERKAFDRLTDEGFMHNGINFLKDLAEAIYKNQAGNPVIEYSRKRDCRTWKGAFFGHEDENQLLLKASPLRHFGNQYRFIHRSMLEYGFARAIFEPLESKESLAPESAMGRRGSSSSILSFEKKVEQEKEVTTQQKACDYPLSWKNFVSEPSIINFLAERVQQAPIFKQKLKGIIELSKTERDWRIAAANAITILVKAGEQFNGANLQGIKIPGADLSYGLFDSADLRDADLRKVNLRNIWMRGANLSRSKMAHAQFGELPLLQIYSEVTVCMYAPDGNTFAVGTDGYKVCIFRTSDWEEIRKLRGHKKPITSIAYSPSADIIASSSKDLTIQVWDIKTGECLHKLHGDSDIIYNIKFSPNGYQIASTTHGKRLQLWDIKLGKCLYNLTGHTIAYSPKGGLIASSSYDNTVQLWDAKTGKCTNTFTGHGKEVVIVAISPNDNQIAYGSNDKTVRFWNIGNSETKESLSTSLTNHKRAIICLVYSPNGNQVASSSLDNTVRLWNAETRSWKFTLTGHSRPVKSIVYSPKRDQNQIASGSEDNTVRLWDTGSGSCLRTLTGHSGPIVSITFSPEGDQIASGSSDKTVRLWNVDSGISGYTSSSHTSSGHSSNVNCVAYLPHSNQIASGSDDRTIRLWDLATGSYSQTLMDHSDKVLGIARSPAGDQIASCSLDETIRLWDVKTGKCISTLWGLREAVHCIAFSPTQQKQSDSPDSSSLQNSQNLPDSAGSPGSTDPSNTPSSPGLSSSPDSSGSTSSSNSSESFSVCWVAFGGTNKTIGLWNLKTLDYEQFPAGHSQPIMALAYSSCGENIASGSSDMKVRLWNVETKSCLHIFDGHHSGINSIAYSPDGNQLVSGSSDSTVRIWDINTGECIHTLIHDKSVSSVAFSQKHLLKDSPENSPKHLPKDSPEDSPECLSNVFQIITASATTIRIWDIALGKCLTEFQNYGSALGINWNGNFLVTGGDDKLVRLWRLKEPQDSQYKACLAWCSTPHELTFTGATIHDTHGLDKLGEQLLKQRGAIQLTLQNTVKKLMQASSVISGLNQMVKKGILDRPQEAQSLAE